MAGSPKTLRVDPRYPSVLDRAIPHAAESFSIVRSRLLGVHDSLGTQTLIITSAEVDEGKTMISLNLALSLGQFGRKRILLVDGDLRKRGVTYALDQSNSLGLNEFLRDGVPFASVVQPTDLTSLSIVSAGHVSEGTIPEILEGPRWREFLDCAKEQFDLVVIDSLPAAAPVADFDLLAAPCDMTLLVVRLRRTTREGIMRALQRIDQKKLLGIVLNDSDHLERYKHYGYYGDPK